MQNLPAYFSIRSVLLKNANKFLDKKKLNKNNNDYMGPTI